MLCREALRKSKRSGINQLDYPVKTPTFRSAINEVKSRVLFLPNYAGPALVNSRIYTHSELLTVKGLTVSYIGTVTYIPSGSVITTSLSVKSLRPTGLTKATAKKYVVYGVSCSIVCTTTSCSKMLKSLAFSLCVNSIVPPSMPYMTTYSTRGPFLSVALGGAHVRSMLRSSMFMKLKF